jgi:hypothetical protein
MYNPQIKSRKAFRKAAIQRTEKSIYISGNAIKRAE